LDTKHLKDTIVRTVFIIFVANLFLTCQLAYPQQENKRQELRQDIKENMKLIKLILRKSNSGAAYTIVEPKTTLDPINVRDSNELSQTKAALKKELATIDYDFGPLIEAFFEINRQSVPIDLKSDTLAGYWINKPEAEKGKNLSQSLPAGHRFTTWVSRTCVSIPAYDKAKGIVLVYISHIWAGQIIAYKLKGGKLIPLKGIQVFIS